MLNWKRGLFRVWLVASALWIVFIVLLVRPDISYQKYYEERAKFLTLRESAYKINTSVCEQFALKPWQKYSEAIGSAELSKSKQSIDVVMACYRHLKPEGSNDQYGILILANMGWSNNEFIEALKNPIDSRDLAYSELRNATLWIMTPPIAFFALGGAMMWAIAGFRRSA